MNNLSERFANYFNLPKRDISVDNMDNLGERVLKVLNTQKKMTEKERREKRREKSRRKTQ